jgi:hypothetical protein
LGHWINPELIKINNLDSKARKKETKGMQVLPSFGSLDQSRTHKNNLDSKARKKKVNKMKWPSTSQWVPIHKMMGEHLQRKSC